MTERLRANWAISAGSIVFLSPGIPSATMVPGEKEEELETKIQQSTRTLMQKVRG